MFYSQEEDKPNSGSDYTSSEEVIKDTVKSKITMNIEKTVIPKFIQKKS